MNEPLLPRGDAVLADGDDPLLRPGVVDWLDRLAAQPWALDAFYVGGTAGLTAYLGHRPASSLDLMSGANRLRSIDRRDLLGQLLEIAPGTRVETARDGYLHVRGGPQPRAPQGVSLRFFYYPYPLIDPEEMLRALPLASALDLGLMKLGAVISRGTVRDFADLYALTRHLPLGAMLDRAPEKFGHVRDFPLQALKGLSDVAQAFDGPDAQPPASDAPLAGYRDAITWGAVTAWIDDDVRRIVRAQLALDAAADADAVQRSGDA